jgi:hypothetical protein
MMFNTLAAAMKKAGVAVRPPSPPQPVLPKDAKANERMRAIMRANRRNIAFASGHPERMATARQKVTIDDLRKARKHVDLVRAQLAAFRVRQAKGQNCTDALAKFQQNLVMNEKALAAIIEQLL